MCGYISGGSTAINPETKHHETNAVLMSRFLTLASGNLYRVVSTQSRQVHK